MESKASRTVVSVVAQNPTPYLISYHRVIRAFGVGTARKKALHAQAAAKP